MGRFSEDNTTSIMEKHAEETDCDFQCLICHCAILGQAGSDLRIPLSQSSHSLCQICIIMKSRAQLSVSLLATGVAFDGLFFLAG